MSDCLPLSTNEESLPSTWIQDDLLTADGCESVTPDFSPPRDHLVEDLWERLEVGCAIRLRAEHNPTRSTLDKCGADPLVQQFDRRLPEFSESIKLHLPCVGSAWTVEFSLEDLVNDPLPSVSSG